MTVNEVSTRIARWRSRRGLLELDLFLVPFANEKYEQCDIKLRRQFDALIQLDDMTLLSWIRNDSTVDEQFAEILEVVRAHRLCRPP